MIGSIKLLPYNTPVPLGYTKNRPMQYTKPPEVDRARPAYGLRRGPFLVHLVFSKEKVLVYIRPT